MKNDNELIYYMRQIIGDEKENGFFTPVLYNDEIVNVPNFLFKDGPSEYPEIRISPFLSKKLKLECGNLTFNYTVCYINNDIIFEEKLLYNNNNLLNNEFYNDLAFVTIFDLEILSRIQNTLINIEDCKNKIKSINNEYWQSIIASLIKLNTDLNDFDDFLIEEHKQCFFNC